MQAYKSLCAAIMICSTLAEIQTETLSHSHTYRQHLISLFDKLSQLS